MRSLCIATAVLLAGLASSPTQAVPVTYDFSGSVRWADTVGDYAHNFGVPLFVNTSFSGSITLESDTVPYMVEPNQTGYFDLVTATNVQFGASGEYGTYTGPGGLQVPPPWGWNSSSAGISTGFYNDGAPYDQVAIYGSIAQRPTDVENAYYRFVLWGVSSQNVFDTFPTLDNLPSSDDFGPLPMGFNLIATRYDDAGGWLGHTTLQANVTSFQRSASVPEPATWSLMLAALAGVGLIRRRRARC
jgi:hypothetical protein